MPAVLALTGRRRRGGQRPPGPREIAAADFFLGAARVGARARTSWRSARAFRRFPAGTGTAFLEVGPPARRLRRWPGSPPRSTVDDGVVAGARAVLRLRHRRAPASSTSTAPVAGSAARDVDWPRPPSAVREHVEPEGDIHATADYRAHLVGVLTRRALGRGRASPSPSTDARRRTAAAADERASTRRADARGHAHASTGSAARAAAPARRLLSDFLRHDLGLTGTHVGCEHGVCGACTVLLDGAAGALVPDVRGHGPGPRDHHGRGLGADADGTMSPVQQAFTECHGLQCGFCTPGFLTTITAYLRGEPRPDRARRPARRSRATCAAAPATRTSSSRVLRAAEIRPSERRRRSVMTHEAVRRSRSSARRTRACVTGGGRYLDDLGHDALAAAFVRSPHAHARILDIDVTDALDVEGVVGDLHLRGPARPGRPSRCRC